MFSLLKKLAVMALAIFNLGCAGTGAGAGAGAVTPVSFHRVVQVNSSPPFATCKIIGEPNIFKTPFSTSLNSGKHYLMRIEKEGFQPELVEVWRPSESLVSISREGTQTNNYRAPAERPPMLGPHTIDVVLRPLAIPEPPPEPKEAPPPPPPEVEEKKPEEGHSKDKALVKELDELYRLKQQGKITAKEYTLLKKKIIDRF